MKVNQITLGQPYAGLSANQNNEKQQNISFQRTNPGPIIVGSMATTGAATLASFLAFDKAVIHPGLLSSIFGRFSDETSSSVGFYSMIGMFAFGALCVLSARTYSRFLKRQPLFGKLNR